VGTRKRRSRRGTPLEPTPTSPAVPDWFRRAVKQALRDLDRPDLLRANALVASQLVRDAASSGDPAAALSAMLRDRARMFASSMRDRPVHDALSRAYLEPIGKQYAAARELGMGYSTFRRHLASALRRLTTALWHDEARAQTEHKPSAARAPGRASNAGGPWDA
jgi:hypothetical protein